MNKVCSPGTRRLTQPRPLNFASDTLPGCSTGFRDLVKIQDICFHSKGPISCPHQSYSSSQTPLAMPREPQGLRGLVGCRLWGRTESDTTEVSHERGRAKCIVPSVYTLMLYHRGDSASTGPLSGPSGPSVHVQQSRLRGEGEA